MSLLLDTNVVRELRKGLRADRNVLECFEGVPEEDIQACGTSRGPASAT